MKEGEKKSGQLPEKNCEMVVRSFVVKRGEERNNASMSTPAETAVVAATIGGIEIGTRTEVTGTEEEEGTAVDDIAIDFSGERDFCSAVAATKLPDVKLLCALTETTATAPTAAAAVMSTLLLLVLLDEVATALILRLFDTDTDPNKVPLNGGAEDSLGIGVAFVSCYSERNGSKSHHVISNYDLISYHMTSYYIISYHIISYLITPCHIISYLILSYHIILRYRNILLYVTLYHIISYHTISHHIISHHITSYYIIS